MTLAFDFERFRATLEAIGGDPVRSIVVHSTIDSTSSDLKRRLENGAPSGTVVVANHQTAGRGRSGRDWVSGEGGNLYLSTSLEVGDGTLEAVPMVPLAAGVAACDAIRDACGVATALKWPNDLLVSGKKLGGILTELVSPGRFRPVVIVGLGVNTGAEAFPPELEGIAVSVPLLKGQGTDPSPLAARFLFGLSTWCRRIEVGEQGQLVDAWRERAEPFGRRVRIGEVEGVTRDLTPEGRLQILKDDGDLVEVIGGIVETLD